MLSAVISLLSDTNWSAAQPVDKVAQPDPQSVRPCAYNVYMTNETQTNNPYVATLVEMGYDEADCQAVAHAGIDATYPRMIHGRVYNTKAEYDEAIADFLNGL